jgi:hypothetical protein
MLLLNPKQHNRFYPDERSREIMLKTIEFFESKGKVKLKADDRDRVWNADFVEFQKQNQVFYTLLTPSGYGEADCRWDTWRNCEFNEILAFYGLCYWYTWQVSILGLGPIWQSENEALKRRAAQLLKAGEVFAFGLSERAHGADIYATEMCLTPQPDGTYRANGEKYYIGNGNKAPMVSTFGKQAGTGDYVSCGRLSPQALRPHECHAGLNYVVTLRCAIVLSPKRIFFPGDRPPGTPRSTPSTSASTTWAGLPSASARMRYMRRSITPPIASCMVWP